MSLNSSKTHPKRSEKSEKKRRVWPYSLKHRVLLSIGLPMWAFISFMLAWAMVVGIVYGLEALGVPLENVNTATFNTIAGILTYALAIGIVIAVPWLVIKWRTTREELGLQRLPSWADIGWAPIGLTAYIIVTGLFAFIAPFVLPFVDYSEVQDTGFNQLLTQSDYIFAFVSLVIIAPFAEELLFRGYLFGKLQKYMPVWGAVLVSSLLFAVVHFQWNVAIDVFALAIVLGYLRVITGSIWASVLLHSLKNAIAFYFLFVNPFLL